MYQAYLYKIRPDDTPVSAPGDGCAVGTVHDDPGGSMNAIRDHHARNVCAAAADYFIRGPDGDVIAHVSMPDATAGRNVGR